jgi:hypothetical protein
VEALEGGAVSYERGAPVATQGPLWGYLCPVLGADAPFLEPFVYHLGEKELRNEKLD